MKALLPAALTIAYVFSVAAPLAAQRGIAIDARMAEDLGLAVGARVRISAKPGEPGDSVTIAAIYERKADPAEVARREYRVRLHLDQLQQLLELDDRVDRFAVGTRDGQSIDSALARINHVAFGFRAHKSRDVAVQSSRTFRVVERFHTAIGLITVVREIPIRRSAAISRLRSSTLSNSRQSRNTALATTVMRPMAV